MTKIWPSIEIIFEQEELVQKSKEVIEYIKESLGQKLGEATVFIKNLNSKTKEDLEEYEIVDRTETLEVRRVLTKRNLMLQLENKCHNLESSIKNFHKKFNVLHQKGLLGLKGLGDKFS